MSVSYRDQLQSPLPLHFGIPPLVQPSWKLRDTANSVNPQACIENLQQALCEKYGVKHCLLLDSARSGIYLLNKAFGLKGGCLSTSFNYRPTAVLMHELFDELSFADIKNDFTMDPSSAEATLLPSTEILYITHMFGKAADIQGLRAFADRHGLFLIENCVHLSNGLQVNKRPVGSWGDASLLSFNLDKPLGGLAGGALLTNRDDVWQAVQSAQLTSVPAITLTERIISSYVGHTLKPYLAFLKRLKNTNSSNLVAETMSIPLDHYADYQAKAIHTLQASIALSRLAEAEQHMQQRIQHASTLNTAFVSETNLQLPKSTTTQPHSYLYYPLVFSKRERYSVVKHYANNGIETKWRYYPLHLQTDFQQCYHTGLTTSEELWNRYLLLPTGHKLTDKHIEHIVKITFSQNQ